MIFTMSATDWWPMKRIAFGYELYKGLIQFDSDDEEVCVVNANTR